MSNVIQKYRFGDIISTPHKMCVHELYTIENENKYFIYLIIIPLNAIY